MFAFTIIHALVYLLITGVILWGIDKFPIDATIKQMVKVVVIVLIAIYLILLLANAMNVPLVYPSGRR